MRKCLNCDNQTKNLKFCCKSCSASYNNKNRVLTDETKDKISSSLKSTLNESSRVVDPENIKKMQDGHEQWVLKQKKALMNDEFESLGYDRKRKRIIIEQNNTCNRCNLSEWMNNPIPLEIDHIDGDNSNNIRSNMEALCPNCHALTDTWRGRNKSSSLKKFTDEEIYSLYLKNGNIRQTLMEMNLSAKGNNYNKIKKIILKFS